MCTDQSTCYAYGEGTWNKGIEHCLLVQASSGDRSDLYRHSFGDMVNYTSWYCGQPYRGTSTTDWILSMVKFTWEWDDYICLVSYIYMHETEE